MGKVCDLVLGFGSRECVLNFWVPLGCRSRPLARWKIHGFGMGVPARDEKKTDSLMAIFAVGSIFWFRSSYNSKNQTNVQLNPR